MFENLGWMEIAVLVLIGLFVFGPERLPKVVADAARMLRTVRQMARNASSELRDELGTDLDIADLHPKRFVRKHLLSEQDEDLFRRPLRDAMRDFEELTHADDVATAHRGSLSDEPVADRHPMDARSVERAPGAATRYDTDAT